MLGTVEWETSEEYVDSNLVRPAEPCSAPACSGSAPSLSISAKVSDRGFSLSQLCATSAPPTLLPLQSHTES